jgi:hypothetical protein
MTTWKHARTANRQAARWPPGPGQWSSWSAGCRSPVAFNRGEAPPAAPAVARQGHGSRRRRQRPLASSRWPWCTRPGQGTASPWCCSAWPISRSGSVRYSVAMRQRRHRIERQRRQWLSGRMD